MTEKKKETPTAPSEQFEAAFGGVGCLVVDCGFCNRTHFATYNRDGGYDPGEKEALLAEQEKAPDGYISHDYSSVGVGYISGVQYVHGCPCNQARKYEEFIWDHKAKIVDYLEKMSKAVLEEAQRDKDLADRGRKALEGEKGGPEGRFKPGDLVTINGESGDPVYIVDSTQRLDGPDPVLACIVHINGKPHETSRVPEHWLKPYYGFADKERKTDGDTPTE